MEEKKISKTIVSGLSAAVFAGILTVGICVCSNDVNTTDVLTETESEKTMNLTVAVSDTDNSFATVKMMLTRTIDNHTMIVDSAIVDSNMQGTFTKVPCNNFSIIATA